MEKVKRKSISKRLKSILFKLQGGKCFYCDKPFAYESEAIGEHKIPISRGGTNKPENYVLSCYTCDRIKGARTLDEFKPELAHIVLVYDISKFLTVIEEKGLIAKEVAIHVEKGLSEQKKNNYIITKDQTSSLEDAPGWVKRKIERYWKNKDR